jgi:hypothetical protein
VRQGILLAAVAAAVLLTTRAPAAPPPAAPATKRAFARAQQLFDAGELARAAALFRELYETTRSPNAHFMLARSLIALDRLPEAHEEMSVALREATDAAKTEPKKYETTRDAAATQLALLDRRVGKIIVVVVPPGVATISIGGAPLPGSKLGVPVAVAPGVVTVEATVSGGAPQRERISIAAGETKTVPLSMAKAGSRPEPERSRPPPEPPLQKSHVRTAGFVIGGVGVAGLILGAATGVGATSKLSRIDEECGGIRCVDPEYAGVIDDGKRLQTITNVALAAGAAATVAGGLMIAFGGPTGAARKPTAQPLSAGVTPRAGGAAIWLAYTF